MHIFGVFKVICYFNNNNYKIFCFNYKIISQTSFFEVIFYTQLHETRNKKIMNKLSNPLLHSQLMPSPSLSITFWCVVICWTQLGPSPIICWFLLPTANSLGGLTRRALLPVPSLAAINLPKWESELLVVCFCSPERGDDEYVVISWLVNIECK